MQGSILDVKDFGALGNERHDDSRAIQSAIDEATTMAGSIVFFPPGVYGITNIVVKARCKLVGSGKATLLKSLPDNQASSLIYVHPDSTWTGISDLLIDGNNTGAMGVLLDGTGVVHTLENLVIQNCGADAIYNKTGSSIFSKIYMVYNAGNGIVLAPTAGDNSIANCHIGHCGKAGINISWAGNWVSDTKVFECGQDGIQVLFGGNKLSDVDVSNNKGNGIYIDPHGNDYGGMISGFFDGAEGATSCIKFYNASHWNVRGHVIGLGGPFDHIVEFAGSSKNNNIHMTYVINSDRNALRSGKPAIAGDAMGNTISLNR